MITLFYHHDGSYTISRTSEVDRRRTARDDATLHFEAVRVVELRDDGSIVVTKDRYGPGKRVLLPALPHLEELLS
jgi:hypothetical protein